MAALIADIYIDTYTGIVRSDAVLICSDSAVPGCTFSKGPADRKAVPVIRNPFATAFIYMPNKVEKSAFKKLYSKQFFFLELL